MNRRVHEPDLAIYLGLGAIHQRRAVKLSHSPRSPKFAIGRPVNGAFPGAGGPLPAREMSTVLEGPVKYVTSFDFSCDLRIQSVGKLFDLIIVQVSSHLPVSASLHNVCDVQ